MVHRTRACAPCRSRRIKCDETLPQCLQCIRFRRECPGPEEGARIVDVTFQTAKKAQRGRVSATKPAKNVTGSGVASVDQRVRSTSAIPMQPDQFPVFVNAFLARFVNYFASNGTGYPRTSWLLHLPSMNSDSSDILRLSICATASAYCALESSHSQLYGKAHAAYGEALHRLVRSIGVYGNVNSQKKPPVEMICGIVLLSFFEAISGTLQIGYCRHLEGALRMLELAGPEQCKSGMLNRLFFTTRVQALLVSFLTGENSFFASAPFLNMPYRGGEEPLPEKLISLMVILIEMFNGYHVDHPVVINGLELDSFSINKAVHLLDDLLLEYETEAIALEDPIIIYDKAKGENVYRDAFTAYLVSYFESARILLLIICQRRYGFDILKDVMEHSCSSILSCVQFLDGQNSGCAFMRVVLPLLLVATHSTATIQREQAIAYFKKWNQRGVIPGLTKIALKTVEGQTCKSAFRISETTVIRCGASWSNTKNNL